MCRRRAHEGGATPAQRYNDLANNALTQCGIYGVRCTVTEWAFVCRASHVRSTTAAATTWPAKFLAEVAIWGSAVRSMVWFDWLSTQYDLYQCGARQSLATLFWVSNAPRGVREKALLIGAACRTVSPARLASTPHHEHPG